MNDVPASLPGHELVSVGLADLGAGRKSESALTVAMAAPSLRRWDTTCHSVQRNDRITACMNC
jgi:hypothetical protein